MRSFVSILLVVLVGFGLVFSDAQAKRFGGGRSFGTYRSASSFTQAKRTAMPMQNAASPNRNRWLGPLAGLAAGGLLASLFMGNGFANGMMSWLLIGGIALLLINLLRSFSRHKAASTASSSALNMMFRNDAAQTAAPQTGFRNFSSANDASSYPAGFDEFEFLRAAKVQFIRLQAAYDKKNLDDIGQFTTPEIFAEIKLQLNERGDKDNHTDVVTLDATLLDVTTSEFRETVATVEFSGLIKEDINEPSASFTEIWHFRKGDNGTWLTAGIQQQGM